MAVNIDILRAELTDDSLARGYSGMSDKASASDLNSIYRERNRTSMTSSEVFQAIDVNELNALTEANRDDVMHVLGFASLDPFGREAVLFTGHFGALSATITALKALRKEAVSRGVELGLGEVKTGHVEEARR